MSDREGSILYLPLPSPGRLLMVGPHCYICIYRVFGNVHRSFWAGGGGGQNDMNCDFHQIYMYVPCPFTVSRSSTCPLPVIPFFRQLKKKSTPTSLRGLPDSNGYRTPPPGRPLPV